MVQEFGSRLTMGLIYEVKDHTRSLMKIIEAHSQGGWTAFGQMRTRGGRATRSLWLKTR